MKAVIMAGGSGTRLRPLTCVCPKPMVPLLDKPVMEYSIEFLKHCGIDSIAVTTQYLPNVIKDYFRDGKAFNVNLNYFYEDVPLGTAGSVKNAQDFLNETFIVISGDALINFDFKQAIQFHRDNHALVTIILNRVQYPVEYGVVINDKNGKITRFLEKPNWQEVFSDTVNTGVYIIEPEVLNRIEANQKVDFSQDVFPTLIGKGLFGYISEDYWCDIGSLSAYQSANDDLIDNLTGYHPSGEEIQKDIWIGKNVEIGKNVVLNPPCFIGDHVSIGENSIIGPSAMIGKNNRIGQQVSIEKSILWATSKVSNKAELSGCVVASNCFIDHNAHITENAVIGDSCYIGANTIIKNGCRIWPEKKIHHHSVINSNVLWQTKEKKAFFKNGGIQGIFLKDMKPEFMLKLGMSIGSFWNTNETIMVGCKQYHDNPTMIDTLLSGISFVGIHVLKIKECTIPVLWTACEFVEPAGAIYIDIKDQQIVIRVYDGSYVELSSSDERKIENILYTCKFNERITEYVGKIKDFDHAEIFYINKFKKTLKKTTQKSSTINLTLNMSNRYLKNLCQEIFMGFPCVDVNFDDASDAQDDNQNNLLYVTINDQGNEFELYSEGQRVDYKKILEISAIMLKQRHDKDKFIIPYSVPETLQNKIINMWGDHVIYSKSSQKEMMRKAVKEFSNRIIKEVDAFDVLFDPLAFICLLYQYLIETNSTMEELMRKTNNYHLSESFLDFPIKKRGSVLRRIIEEESDDGKSIELFEGVKIRNQSGYTLITQAKQNEQFRIISEAISQEVASELTEHYKLKMEKIKSES